MTASPSDAGAEPRRIGEMLPAAVGRDRADLEAIAALFDRWDQVVGARVARHVRPLRLEGATLVVAVDQGAWATQIQVLRQDILRRLGEVTGDRVSAIEVVIRRP